MTIAPRSRFQRYAAWLALLAVVMLFVAPVISKSLAHRAACTHNDAATMAMDMPAMAHDMTSSELCDEPVMMPGHDMMPGPGMSPGEEIVCGYCLLLVHLPFMQFAVVMLLWLLLHGVGFIPAAAPCCAVIFRPWSPQCARAPPAVFLPVF